MRTLAALLSLLQLAGCAGGDDVGAEPAAVVYGADDRQDWYEATDPTFADRLERSTVVLVEPEYIDVSDPASVVPDTVTLGEYQDLCDGERYASQPAMGSCSGTLIDDDLVLTAAHCVDATVCADWYFVFDFVMDGPTALRSMTSDDVYRCAEILVWELTPDGEPVPWHDYAIVRLDRPVDAQREPAPVEMDPGAVSRGDSLTVLGFGDGIPGKVHGGGRVVTARIDWAYFVGSSDTFAGNSGSGTYDEDHRVVGIFVRGGDDDYARAPGGCFAPNVVAPMEGTQEYDYAYLAVDDLCAAGHESARLCGSPDAGAPDAGSLDAGSPTDAGATDAGVTAPEAGADVDAGAPPPEGDGGCGCRVGARRSTGAWWGVALVGLVWRRARR